MATRHDGFNRPASKQEREPAFKQAPLISDPAGAMVYCTVMVTFMFW